MANVPGSGPAAPPPPPVWNAGASGSAAVAYGGFWIRVVAYLIDAILLGGASAILASLLGVDMFGGEKTAFDPTVNVGSLIIGWLYFALMESSERGATLGKMAVGLRVVTDQGERLSFGRASGRYFAKLLSALILCIGFIMVAFTDRKRGLHDMIASTLVVKVR